MYQDERAITPNQEAESGDLDPRLIMNIINTSSQRFRVYYLLKSGSCIKVTPIVFDNKESDSDSLFICDTKREVEFIFGTKELEGPSGTLVFQAENNEDLHFQIYFDLSILPSNPRCSYVYQQGVYSMASPICCFPEKFFPEKLKNNYITTFTISDPVLCNSFYHVSDSHFSEKLKDKAFAEKFTYAHRSLFDRINSDDKSLGLIHTGDVCTYDECFSDYCNFYLKAKRIEDNFEPKYLKNLYEGYGYYDKSQVIDRIRERHEIDLTRKTFDQCIFEGCDSEEKLHYYWTWHGVRFIHLNLAPIDEKDTVGHEGYNALSYLKYVLNIWGNRRPVILCFHYLLGYWTQLSKAYGFLSEQQIKDFWDVIKDYNICAILCGQVHLVNQGLFNFKYNNDIYTTNIPCYCSGAIEPHREETKNADMSYYNRFEFDDTMNKIRAFQNEISFPDNSDPQTHEYQTGYIDITEGKKPTCDINPVPAPVEEV